MKVFLSYALPFYDGNLPARLRANALGFNIELLLPNADERNILTTETKRKIKQSQAVIALVTSQAAQINAVNMELQEAARNQKEIVAFVENPNLVTNVPRNRMIIFDRHNYAEAQNRLFQVLQSIQLEQEGKKNLVIALFGLGAITLGLVALGELTKEK
jgi:hypothetical protein